MYSLIGTAKTKESRTEGDISFAIMRIPGQTGSLNVKF